jgi:hypothetical protein
MKDQLALQKVSLKLPSAFALLIITVPLLRNDLSPHQALTRMHITILPYHQLFSSAYHHERLEIHPTFHPVAN